MERKTERNGKRNETEFRRETKYMNFVDTTACKGLQFEIKQKLLIFNQVLANKTFIFNIQTSLMLTILQFSKDSLNLRGKNSSFEKYKRLL